MADGGGMLSDDDMQKMREPLDKTIPGNVRSPDVGGEKREGGVGLSLIHI